MTNEPEENDDDHIAEIRERLLRLTWAGMERVARSMEVNRGEPKITGAFLHSWAAEAEV